MASAERTEVFDVAIDKLFKVITDYENYPDFMDGVSSVNLIERKGNKAKVEFHINIIKKFNYTLLLTEEAPNKLSWTFESGDLFKRSEGAWELKDNGDGSTEVTYRVDIDFKMMVPSMMTKKLVSGNLPSMMKSVAVKAKEQ